MEGDERNESKNENGYKGLEMDAKYRDWKGTRERKGDKS